MTVAFAQRQWFLLSAYPTCSIETVCFATLKMSKNHCHIAVSGAIWTKKISVSEDQDL